MKRPLRSSSGRSVDRRSLVFVAAFLFLTPAVSWATLPLISDDADTQGKGKFLLEVGGEYDRDRGTEEGLTVRENDYSITATVTAGLYDRFDVFVSLPYQWVYAKTEGIVTADANGIGDLSVGLKWRFYENGGLGLAVKPGFSVPTGDDEEGLGSGKVDYGVLFIASADREPWEVHVNIGYLRNENTLGERKDLWRVSLAAQYEVIEHVKLCADIGRQTNRDRTSEVEPAYLLGGVIYSIGKDVDLSLGVKVGLNSAETDLSILPGITYRF